MNLDVPILFEDTSLLVINKPPGIVVNRAESVKEETIQDWALLRQGSGGQVEETEDKSDFYARAGIVHRIDKETSGCLLIAKTPESFVELQRQFKEREIKKTYLAIVHGKLVPAEGEIRAPVGRLPWNRERFGIVPGGKEAVTKYRVQGIGHRVEGEDLSLVELYPETGRTHQIRVHLKYINHPIVGDYLYAGRKTSRSDRAIVGRVMLHAWKISFRHPKLQTQVDVEAPIPDDMSNVF
ncbi:MAG TPA: RluA family pseudouridine synthase [Patescibacteria group bacterium]|nr:RluA family pseudouridine synthase [Patescibacteria group bacterium]